MAAIKIGLAGGFATQIDNARDVACRAAAVPQPFGLRGPCQLRLRGDLSPVYIALGRSARWERDESSHTVTAIPRDAGMAS